MMSQNSAESLDSSYGLCIVEDTSGSTWTTSNTLFLHISVLNPLWLWILDSSILDSKITELYAFWISEMASLCIWLAVL